LSELNKYEVFLSELNTLETQTSILAEKLNDIMKQNKEFETQINLINKENEFLKLQVRTLEREVETFKGSVEKEAAFISLPAKEKESIKLKINELISRINYHLSSS
jgi:predicted  nucleic acid-binding Zn-ribbon protein